jgi:DNA-nicking Smr family endonuclease
MSEDKKDNDVWHQYINSMKVMPLAKTSKHKNAAPSPKKITVKKNLVTVDELASYAYMPMPQAKTIERSISATQAKRIDQGKLPIDGRLDLHGLTQLLAMEKFINYINDAYTKGKRMLLVITGKGKNSESGQGKLKQALLEWVNSPLVASKILRCTPAKQQHGGTGAFYIFLRRNNELANR